MRFTDRVAIITAAASGIGRATAEIMAREGAVVIAVDIDEGRLDDTVAMLCAGGGRAHAKRADVLVSAQGRGHDRVCGAGVRRYRHPG
jgi:NAD(P)-dependent dehydrogenase (short-subunit alcohol dehydrogenase family)